MGGRERSQNTKPKKRHGGTGVRKAGGLKDHILRMSRPASKGKVGEGEGNFEGKYNTTKQNKRLPLMVNVTTNEVRSRREVQSSGEAADRADTSSSARLVYVAPNITLSATIGSQ